MASIGDLSVKLSADGRDLEKGLDKAGNRMEAVGKKFRNVGKRMSLAVTAPIVGLGLSAVTTAAKFEKEMNRVRALSGATGDDFDSLRDQARELGRSTMFSATQSADAMGFLAMAGFKTKDILGAMPSVLNLAAAGNMGIADTADIASNILTGFGLEVEQLAAANDTLVKATTSANVDLYMLGETMKYVAPVASSAGASLEEMTAAAALLGNAGVQGSMAGTTLRAAITNLLKPTEEVTAEIRRLGIQTHDSEGNLNSLTDIIRQLENRGADTASIMTIFGRRAGSGMAALISQGSEALANMEQALIDAGGTAEEIAEIQMEGLAGSFVEFKSAMEDAQITMGNVLLPTLTDLLDKHLTPLLKKIDELPESQKKIITWSAIFVAAIAPILMMLGMMMPALAFLFANPIGLAILAIGLAIATVIVWMNNWEENIQALMDLWGIFDYRMRQIFGIETWNDFKNVVSGNIGSMIDGVQGLWDVFKGIWDLLNGDWDAAGEHFKAAAKHFEDAFWHALDMIGGLIGLIKDAFLGLMDELGAFIFGREFWETIKDNFMSQKDKVVEYFSEFVDKMARLWGNLWGALMDVFSGNIDGAIQHLKDATDVLIESLNQAIDGFNKLNPLKDVPKIKTFAERGLTGESLTGGDKDAVHNRQEPGVNVTVQMLGNNYGMDDFEEEVSRAVATGVRRGGYQGVINT